MPAPVLIAVDEDPAALERVETQLNQRYGHDYRVIAVGDLETAARTIEHLHDVAEEVAILLVDTPLLDAGGVELLERTAHLHPQAKRGLLVTGATWAERITARALLDAMALGLIDYYVPTPADQPDEVFHQAVSSFLLEWATDRRLVPHTIHVVGDDWTGQRAYELRTVFERCAVPHAFCLADSDEGRALLADAGPNPALPAMVLPDGRVLTNPTNMEIAAAAGAATDLTEHAFEVVIVGSGPAGLSAAVYAASEGLRTLVIDEGGIGGQARSSSLIRNYLGFPRGVSGSRLAEQAYQQAVLFGASFLFMHRVASLDQIDASLTIGLEDGRQIDATTVILATGASYRRLEIPALEALTGAGVFYGGTTSEAQSVTGKDVFVAGGGNSAGQAVLHLARYARRVTLLVRASSLEVGMSHYLTQEIEATPNVEVRTSTVVVGGGGEGRLQELTLRDTTRDEEESLAADALFVLIGARPHTDWLPQEVARDERGFVFTGDAVPEERWALPRRPLPLETSLPNVLAVGDARHGSVKRVASAVGEGSVAIQHVHTLLGVDALQATGA